MFHNNIEASVFGSASNSRTCEDADVTGLKNTAREYDQPNVSKTKRSWIFSSHGMNRILLHATSLDFHAMHETANLVAESIRLILWAASQNVLQGQIACTGRCVYHDWSGRYIFGVWSKVVHFRAVQGVRASKNISLGWYQEKSVRSARISRGDPTFWRSHLHGGSHLQRIVLQIWILVILQITIF